MFKSSTAVVRGLVTGLAIALAAGTAWAADDRLRGAVEPVTAMKPYRIGVATVHFVDDYWKGISYGLVDEAKHANVEIVRLLGAGGYGRVVKLVNVGLMQRATLDSARVSAQQRRGGRRGRNVGPSRRRGCAIGAALRIPRQARGAGQIDLMVARGADVHGP